MKKSILLFLLCSSLFTRAQNDLRSDDLFYSISIGAGIGKSPNFEYGNYGIGGMFDFTLQKNKSLATIGYRGTGEFEILAPTYPARTMTSIELLYGRELTNKKLIISIHAGIGFVGNLERGEFLYYGPGFFSSAHYKKIRSYTVGLPISSKVLIPLSNHFGLGLEGYININSENTFYGLNLCASFKKYKFKTHK